MNIPDKSVPPSTVIPKDISEVGALQNLCDGLQSQLERKEKEIEAERALKWLHFENAVKFDEEVRELKKRLHGIGSNDTPASPSQPSTNRTPNERRDAKIVFWGVIMAICAVVFLSAVGIAICKWLGACR